MKLRPSNKDRKAIDKLKKHYGTATSTKAILRAVYDVPILQQDVEKLTEKISAQNQILMGAQTAMSLFLDGIEDLKLSRKEITNR